ncbi:nucleotide-binding universal stress UspA family protein [Nonlabens dokdonensis]|jgi:nucleotide-binding universal stress UspA family protein|uniref:Nucleotide-binding universal stress UspA family protein n=2 Tax=Nonlabens dokdonensis TaxID=328515 RepID=A0ABX5PZS2_9FLAO|nr:universal stress protein [Nonlabens dokdonensis]AGC75423.1 putative universal stress protein [Nonlabens dokdonensis DSW-6]PZX43122.1 nucleotide-binding universal stress UspA family protein [Nonlabens dokdonensis]
MKSKILIPTDFSLNAWNAIQYALKLYKNKECDFHILNTYSSSVPSKKDLVAAKADELSFQNEKTKSAKGLEEVLEKIQSTFNNEKHSFTTVSLQDDLLSAMKTIVEKRDIELVIMGTKGASNYRATVLGSNTINTMENLRVCPIVGVPYDAEEVSIKQIIFPTSFKTHYKRKELNHLVELAVLQAANICVLHVSSKENLSLNQKENKELLKECLEGASFTFQEVESSHVADGIRKFVSKNDSDMIAFVNRKHSFFSTIFNKPLVQDLGMLSELPLFVMHDLRN